ncbi:MAG TPA: 2-oxoglutarate dehydrogenase complex dihydrolipoyllysine-residue succinyltransferase [Planctomycetota bacterium]|nr:2-oxoglutarate dehydrogenase complex dihydrolipoyllysine-residue succinyltransferase [Planctomycetota bacterium]
MPVELKVPQVGESISEVQVGEWLKSEGDSVERDDAVVTIESDKATVEVSAPVSGTVAKVLKKAGETARVGEVIGYMEEVAAGSAGASAAKDSKTKPRGGREQKKETDVVEKPVEPREPAPGKKPSAAAEPPAPGESEESEESEEPEAARKPSPAEARAPTQSAPRAAPRQVSSGAREEEIVPMSPLRRRVARHLVEAQHAAALLTTFNEIDMGAVMTLRREQGPAFLEKHGVKLGIMSFFIKAAIDALKLVPQVNAEVRGEDIVFRNYHDIGVAVGGGKGLVVPVLRDAGRMSFAEIEAAIADFAVRAQESKLKVEELRGGTFTLSNGGIYGSLLSTPIVNAPESGILGMHAIQDRPVARDGQVVIRPMMYVALTYDHRIIDGREAVTFLKRIKECIESPLRLLMDV